MASSLIDVEYNYKTICENIAKASQRCNKSESDITLLAATKTVDIDTINYAIEKGIKYIGENEVQELLLKDDSISGAHRHFIGHLQTNKIKYIAPFVHLIESLDSERLAAAIDREAAKCGRTIDCLLEIHVTDEESKSGWEWSELKAFVEAGGFQH